MPDREGYDESCQRIETGSGRVRCALVALVFHLASVNYERAVVAAPNRARAPLPPSPPPPGRSRASSAERSASDTSRLIISPRQSVVERPLRKPASLSLSLSILFRTFRPSDHSRRMIDGDVSDRSLMER